jgi:phosphatidate cytidylyltransferase
LLNDHSDGLTPLLRWRLTLGTLFIAALVGLCWLDARAAQPGVVLLPLAILFSLAAAGELLAMFRKLGHDPLAWVVYAGTLLVVLAAVLPVMLPTSTIAASTGPLGSLAIAIAAALLLALVGEMFRFDESGAATINVALAFFAIAYAGGLFGLLELIRSQGMLALISLIAIVKMSDIGQYTVGRLFGKHKLAPRISPGKTWEGVAGGILFAWLTAWITFRFASSSADNAFLRVIAYATALAITGILGDLAESMLKRDAGAKDSSTWLPGFGGVLDLLDSLLGAAPVAYLFWAMHWIG